MKTTRRGLFAKLAALCCVPFMPKPAPEPEPKTQVIKLTMTWTNGGGVLNTWESASDWHITKNLE